MKSKRNGDWFLTYTGKQFYPLDPRPDDVCIEDIAHALSNVCRFGGHCRRFYSVAQHSVFVSEIVKQPRLQALMHDATEAYCGDVVRPLKYAMPNYIEIEDRIWSAICERFELAVKLHPEVKPADNRALMTERRDILIPSNHSWSLEAEFPPLDEVIEPAEPYVAEILFMERFKELQR